MSTITALNFRKELNNSTMKFLAFWGIFLGLALGLFLPQIALFVSVVVYLMVFVGDRSFLEKQNAFVPHWGWALLFPVYLFKRQRRNGLGLTWFWIWLATTVLARLALAFFTVALSR